MSRMKAKADAGSWRAPSRGQLLQVEITALDAEGRGVAALGEGSVCVPGWTPGAVGRVVVEGVSLSKRVVWARGHALDWPGPDTRQPTCHWAAPLRGRCGGCPLAHLRPDAARTWKVAVAREAGCAVAEIHAVSGEQDEGYRNRSALLAFRDARGVPRLGSRAARSGEPVQMTGCRVVPAPLRETADRLRAVLEREGVPVAAEAQGVRWLGLRANRRGEILVEWVTRPDATWVVPLIQRLAADELWRGVVSWWWGTRTPDDNVLRSEETQLVAGQPSLDETFDGRTYPLGPRTFFQLNTRVAEALAQHLSERWAALKWPRGPLLELYAGVGTLGHSLLARGLVSTVRGIEVVPESVAIAQRVGESLAVSLPPASTAGAWDVLDLGDPGQCARLTGSAPASAVVNPPRRGLDEGVVDWIVREQPSVLAYVSCNPESLQRDAARLVAAGYRRVEESLWDMLPQTAHVEVLSLWERA